MLKRLGLPGKTLETQRGTVITRQEIHGFVLTQSPKTFSHSSSIPVALSTVTAATRRELTGSTKPEPSINGSWESMNEFWANRRYRLKRQRATKRILIACVGPATSLAKEEKQ